ncbi:DUF421 domain-containing protein [Adhaeribacter soli]|nr:YetF domain-containing protein [Adhaeribacter soli]
MEEFFEALLGTQGDITWWQMGLRAVIVFIAALIILRTGDRRVFGKNTALDIVMGIVLGSVLSRAITGNAPFGPALFTSVVLMGLHRITAYFAFHYPKFGKLVKGRELQLIKNGQFQEDALAQAKITRNDLEEATRQNSVENLQQVKDAFIERNGSISIIKAD